MEYLTAQQVVVILGISENTLNFWYRFKRENPDNEYAQLLPDYYKQGLKERRYWKREDLWKFTEFQNAIPKGRNGVMGKVTQRYYKENDNGKKKSNNRKTSRTGKQ